MDHKKKKKELPPLPPDWKELKSDKGHYYWNKVTNTTQWSYPMEEAFEFAKLQNKHTYINLPDKESVSEDKGTSQTLGGHSRSNSKDRRLLNTPSTEGKSKTLPPVRKEGQAGVQRPGATPSALTKNETQSSSAQVPSIHKAQDSKTGPRPPPLAPPIPPGKPALLANTESKYDEVPPSTPPPRPLPDMVKLKDEQKSDKLGSKPNAENEYDEVPPSTPPPRPNPVKVRPSYRQKLDKLGSKSNTENMYDEVHSPSPPPIPERNYAEEDIRGINSPGNALGVASDLPEDSPPPPIPERTELSTQLISPSPLKDHFIYKSNLSDLSRIGLEDSSTGDVSPNSAAANKEVLQFTTDTEVPVHVDSTVSNTTNETGRPLVYDEIIEPGLRGRGVVTGIKNTTPPQNQTEGVIYDEIPSELQLTRGSSSIPLSYDYIGKPSLNSLPAKTSTAPIRKQHSSDLPTCTSPGDRPPMELPPIASRLSPASSKRPVLNSHLPPVVSPSKTPPTAHSQSSRESSPLPPCLAYEVVPLNITGGNPSSTKTPQTNVLDNDDTEEIFMTVNHEQQRQRFSRFSGSLHNSRTPPVPPRRERRGSESLLESKAHSSSNSALDKDDNMTMYDKLDHIRALKNLGATLPRADATRSLDAEYSTLNIAQQKVLMRAGIRVDGSLMNSSTSDISDMDNRPRSQENGKAGSEEAITLRVPSSKTPSPVLRQQQHFYDDVHMENDGRRNSDSVLDSNKIPLVFAPNIPTPEIRPLPHLYEDINRDKASEPSIDRRRQSPNRDQRTTNGGDVPLVFAPNVPSSEAQRQPHRYEDIQSEEAAGLGARDTPSLVWDDDGFVPSKKGVGSGFTGNNNKERDLTAQPNLQRPPGISDEDYQRRLDRLDNHFYPTIDIPSWPNQNPTLSPKQRTDINSINRVVRDSWQPRETSDTESLPEGWKKELNEQGQEFYWHIPTGKIQYVRPDTGTSLRNSKSQSPSDAESLRSPTAAATPTTFAAEYWGSCEVEEDKLVKGKSVQVVLACIRDILDNDPPTVDLIPCAGLERRSSVYVQISGMELRWMRADDNLVVTTQIINRIRVWGVGQENEREFGYISRNPLTNKHVCHVFVCDIAAMGIAQAMLDSHGVSSKGKLSGMSRRSSMADELTSSDGGTSDGPGGTVLVHIPLAAAHRERSVTNAQQHPPQNVDKAPKEEYKRLEATYIGFTDVLGPHGIDVVNEAVQQLSIAKSRWLPVYVDIATSHIKILDRKSEKVLKEHRVRFLSFLGISSDERYCGYIVDNGDNQFLFHGFQCLPNADKFCLALHSACQARYQRVIDAHLTEGEIGNIDSSPTKSPKKSLLRRIGSWKMKRKESEDESSRFAPQSFIIQFLGYEQIQKPAGVESITTPLKKYSQKTSGVHLVEFIVATSGFTINDPQKKEFSSKHIPAKKITYCAKIRSHFVFISKESGKYYCYMFTESDVDISNITKAIGDLIT